MFYYKIYNYEGVPFKIVKGGLCSEYAYFKNIKKEN